MIRNMKANKLFFSALTIVVLFLLLAVGLVKQRWLGVLTSATVAPPIPALPTKPPESKGTKYIAESYAKLPLSFEANHGQLDSQVEFRMRGTRLSLFLTSAESVLVVGKSNFPKTRDAASRLNGSSLPADDVDSTERVAVHMKLLGANPRARVEGSEELPGKNNYFIGKDSTKWRTNVPTYAKVNYRDVYPGIDQIFYGTDGRLEYDFVVRPGSDPKRIALSYRGVDKFEVDAEGDLVLQTALGVIRQRKPIVYQNIAGVRKEISAEYFIKGKREIAFRLGAYDASESLIIDPVLSYSTFLGSGIDNNSEAIAVDAAGNAYVTGETNANDFPTTAGAFQTANGGNADVFVTKLNPTGSALVYSTYLGGAGDEGGRAIAVDALGNSYVTGFNASPDFPTTASAFQTALAGSADAFVVKLNATGSALVYSTNIGGSAGDAGFDLAVDGAGAAYVTGNTSSIDFPTTAGSFATSATGGFAGDAFVTKIDASGATILYSTYLGGSDADEGNGIAVDSAGSAYVTGFTQCFNGNGCASPNFPTTAGAFKSNTNVDSSDLFVTRLNATGSGLVYSTYLGGTGNELPGHIAIDLSGSAFVTGATNSFNFPITSGSFQTSYNGAVDGFVTKLNAAGSGLIFSTYLGGNGTDVAQSIAVDSSGSAYVTGETNSTNFPTVSAIQGAFAGGFNGDAFVTKFNANGTSLVYSTYLGGSDDDFALDIAVDALPGSNAYVTGRTLSLDFPTTAGTFQSTAGPAFIAKIADNTPSPTPTPTPGVGPPANKDQCKDGGWQTFNVPRTFRTQGDCIQFVNTGR